MSPEEASASLEATGIRGTGDNDAGAVSAFWADGVYFFCSANSP